jgi:CheY-like chemotaxis protein
VSRRLGLDLRLAEWLPPVRGDPNQLRQVVMNLVINAAESMGDGDGTVTVATSVARVGGERLRAALLGEALGEGRYLCLEVSDTGCGMDPATQRRIFEPFFTSKFAGRGLGLSAVLGIVRQFGGAIELSSTPGRGSVFRVLLPAAEGGAAKEVAPREADAWTGSGEVLVVDDDPAVRRAVGRLLGRLGFLVLEAASGAEGIALYGRHLGRIRAVILDLTMPGLDGVETLRELRRMDPAACVVVASGHGEDEVAARFRGAPADGFVQKPFTLGTLRARLEAALHGRAPLDGTGRLALP